MKSAILIGCGNIGFRHFQALIGSEDLSSIDLVDLNSEAIQKCLSHVQEIKDFSKKINTHSSLGTIAKSYDVAIVATNSLHRAGITCDLLKQTTVGYLILEKFLFPKLSDYHLIQTKIQETNTKTYVNCPRRYYPYNRVIKDFFKSDSPESFLLNGVNWSLACNSVHFVDLFSYLLNDQGEFNFNSESLDRGFIASKRPGYVEFLGTLKGSIGPSSVELTCLESQQANNISIEIRSPHKKLLLFESGGIAKIEFHSQDGIKRSQEATPFQSSLTKFIIKDLFEIGKCELPTYHISMQEHVSLLRCFLAHYNQALTEKVDSCPIT